MYLWEKYAILNIAMKRRIKCYRSDGASSCPFTPDKKHRMEIPCRLNYYHQILVDNKPGINRY